MPEILLIDDDREFGEVLSGVLSENGFEVDYEEDGYRGLEQEKEKKYDLLLIDLYLGKLMGIQLVELIRVHNLDSRIIILTNSGDDTDEIKSLKLDIDEYIRKNTSVNVMIQRINKVLEKPRSKVDNDKLLKSIDERITLDINNRSVFKNDENIHLTQLELDLLECFLQNKNKLLSREAILKQVWKLDGEQAFIDTRTVDVHIKNLRRKLKLRAIQSIRGIGYRWREK